MWTCLYDRSRSSWLIWCAAVGCLLLPLAARAQLPEDQHDAASPPDHAASKEAKPDEEIKPGEEVDPEKEATPSEEVDPEKEATAAEEVNPEKEATPGEEAAPGEERVPGVDAETIGSPASDSAEAASTGLEEIVVTATRRATNLMETPVAVTAVSQESLIELNVTNVLSIERLVPSLKVQDQRTLGIGAVQFSMRGIGNTNFTEQGDPNVGFHVDSVYVARPQAAISFLYDVERIEVLRGPQGTLFGRNSTVGTINVVSAKPEFGKAEGRVDGQLGSYHDQMVRGVVNLPVFENLGLAGDLALRVTAFAHARDSFYDLRPDTVLSDQVYDDGSAVYPTNPYLTFGNPTDTREGAGAVRESGMRAMARWRLFDDLELTGTYEVFQNESPPAPLTVRESPTTAYMDMPNTLDQTIYSTRLTAEYNLLDAVTVAYNFGNIHFNQELTLDLDAGRHRYRTSSFTALEEDQFFWDKPFRNDSWSHEAQIRSSWDLPVNFLLGYFRFQEDSKRNLWIDIPQPAGGVILFNQPQRIAKSQAVFGELSYEFLDKFNIRGGLRYSMDQKIDRDGSRLDNFPGPLAGTFGCPIEARDMGLSPSDARTTLDANGNRVCGISSAQQQNMPPYTVFDRVFNNDEEFEKPTWSVTASYQANDDLMAYGTAATGYKSGGFQDTFFLIRTGEVIFPVLEPEDLLSFELGAKAELLNGSLHVAANGYFMSYKNKQESVLVDFGDMFCPYTFGDFNGDGRFDPGVSLEDWASFGFSDAMFDADTLQTTATEADYARCRQANFDLSTFSINMVELVPLNITDATTGGAEVEWFWQLSSNDRFSGFVTLILHNRIGNIDVSQLPLSLGDGLACNDREGGCPSVESLDGNKLPFAPVFSMAANYAHDFDLGEYGWLTAQAFLNVSSSYYLSIWNVDCYTSVATGEQVCDNGDKQDAYATVDVNVRYNSEFSDWYLEAYGTNLTGTVYATFNHRNGADGVTGYAFNAPRQFGMRGGFRW